MLTQEQSTVLQFGQASLRLVYDAKNGWIYGDWIGVHSLNSIQKGMNTLLEWIQQTGASKYLSDNTNIVGGWNTANEWLADVWTPLAVDAGMRYVAHVLAPGIFGQMSMEALEPQINNMVTLQLFDSIEDAQHWLSEQ